MSRRTVQVGGDPGYPVHIGPGALQHLRPLVRVGRRVMLIHQPGRAGLAGQAGDLVREAGGTPHLAEVPDAEAAKQVGVLAELWHRLGRADFTRDDLVVGIGGGAVTDLAGFVAATWLRGVEVVQVPTSLLAVVDAAVGGKTGINTAEGKNLVGAFHPPVAVLCDPSWLTTMPRADYVSGLAEVVKCGLVADPLILDLVEADPAAATRADAPVALALIARAVKVKADIVAADLKEASLREVLNYGHTFAHAIELVEDYRWRHGDAVAVGLVYAAELGRRAGRTPDSLVDRTRAVLAAVGLPTTYAGGSWEELRAAMGRDKKARGATLRFVVLDALARPGRLEGPAEELLVASFEAVRG